MERIIALDIGTVRIGVAVSDPSGTFAQPLDVLQSEGNWLSALEEITAQFDARVILVGMPRRTDGTDGPEAGAMRAKMRKIADRFPAMQIVEWDERFTTTIATQALLEGDVSRRDRKSRVDKVAASLLLQSYLDAKSGAAAGQDVATAALPPAVGERHSGKNKRNRAYD